MRINKILRCGAIIALIFFPHLFLLDPALCQEQQVSSSRGLTIKNAIDTAIMNNYSVRIQEEELEYAKGNVLYARSLFLPNLSAGYAYTHTDAVLTSEPLPGHRKDTLIFQGYKNDNLVNIAVNETIYNGGANIATLNQAKLSLKIQSETLRATKLEIEFEAKRLFFGLLLAYETERIAQDLVNQAKAHYDNVKQKYEQGTASKFDVLQSSVQVSRLIPQLVQAKNAIDILMAEFKRVLALDMKEEVSISGKLEFKENHRKEAEFLTDAYNDNPEMRLKLLGVDLNKWVIELAKAGWLPQLTANASYTYRSGDLSDIFNSRHDNWSVGIKTSIAIFDGFATKAKVDQAKAQYNEAILEKEDVIDKIAVGIKEAYLNMGEAKAIIESQMSSIEEAKEALRLANVRFDNGVGINLDVFDAEVSLAEVEQNLAQGIYDYIMAEAQLERLSGNEFKENYYVKN